VLAIQRVWRGFHARCRYAFVKYWQKRARRREKIMEQLEAKALKCARRVYTGLAIQVRRPLRPDR
jgi:hypothetical protein